MDWGYKLVTEHTITPEDFSKMLNVRRNLPVHAIMGFHGAFINPFTIENFQFRKERFKFKGDVNIHSIKRRFSAYSCGIIESDPRVLISNPSKTKLGRYYERAYDRMEEVQVSASPYFEPFTTLDAVVFETPSSNLVIHPNTGHMDVRPGIIDAMEDTLQDSSEGAITPYDFREILAVMGNPNGISCGFRCTHDMEFYCKRAKRAMGGEAQRPYGRFRLSAERIEDEKPMNADQVIEDYRNWYINPNGESSVRINRTEYWLSRKSNVVILPEKVILTHPKSSMPKKMEDLVFFLDELNDGGAQIQVSHRLPRQKRFKRSFSSGFYVMGA